MATDGQTVIRSLKSVFAGNANEKGKPFIFLLGTHFTPIILLLLAGLIFWQRMTNEHINCYTPPEEDIRARAVNQYCFVTGTYTISGYPVELKSLKKNLPYPGVGPRIPPSATNGGGTGVKYHMYFQWVPFVLLVQAILFSVPNLVWKSLRKDTLTRYSRSLMPKEDEDKDENKTADDHIAKVSKRFLRNLKHHSSFVRWFITSEIISLVVVILAFHLSDMLLTGQFFYLGLDWFNFLQNTPSDSDVNVNSSMNPLDQIFPKMSKCEFKKFGPGGSIINYDLLCVMTLNVFHDKVFLLLWFWFVALMIAQFINLFVQLVVLRFRDFQCKLILNRVEYAFLDDGKEGAVDIDPNFKGKAKQFIRTLGYSDWFLLRAISLSVGTEQFTKFFKYIVNDSDEDKERTKKSEDECDNTGRYAPCESFGDTRGKGGMCGCTKTGTNFGNTFTRHYVNETNGLMHLTRNRNHNYGDNPRRENLYTPLNHSLMEMRQEQDMEEKISLIDHARNKFSVTSNVPPIPQQFDVPDERMRRELSSSSFQNHGTMKNAENQNTLKGGEN